MLVSVNAASQMLNVSEKELYRLIKQSAIPYHKINDLYFFNRTEILEWATERHIKLSSDMFMEESAGRTTLPSLLAAVKTGGILYHIEGNDQGEALRSIVDLIQLPDSIDRDFLYQVLLSRETMGSTAIGNGIAIPHVRDPVVLQVAEPSVTICFLETPIDFKALDGKPVHILFTLISPTMQTHLHLLSRIGFVLHNRDFNDALVKKAAPDELLDILKKAEAEIPAPQSPRI